MAVSGNPPTAGDPGYGSREGLRLASASRNLAENRLAVEKRRFRPDGDCGSKRQRWAGARGGDPRHLLPFGGGGEAQLPEGYMAGDPRASLRYHPLP